MHCGARTFINFVEERCSNIVHNAPEVGCGFEGIAIAYRHRLSIRWVL
jgi:hypothetical protein